MNEPENLLTASIDDYLIALGESLHKAQRQLSQLQTVVQAGDAPITYHVPRLDFEFRVSFELSRSEEAQAEAPGKAATSLRLRPAQPSPNAGRSTSSAESTSVIKGSFVAIPTRGGKPPPIIRTALAERPDRRVEVRVEASTAAGERVVGVEVNFNIDRDLSRRLTLTRFNQFAPRPGTGFLQGMVPTDASGLAIGVLAVDPGEQSGLSLAMRVDVLGSAETIVYQVP